MNKLIGKRIRLTYTSDRYTSLKPGDEGLVVDVSNVGLPPRPFSQVWIKWDNGSNLALVLGEDKFEVL